MHNGHQNGHDQHNLAQLVSPKWWNIYNTQSMIDYVRPPDGLQVALLHIVCILCKKSQGTQQYNAVMNLTQTKWKFPKRKDLLILSTGWHIFISHWNDPPIPKDAINLLHVLYRCSHSGTGLNFICRDTPQIDKEYDIRNESEYDPYSNSDNYRSNDEDITAGGNEKKNEDEGAA